MNTPIANAAVSAWAPPAPRPAAERTPFETFSEWWRWNERHAENVRVESGIGAAWDSARRGRYPARGWRAAWRSELGTFARWVAERVDQMSPRGMTPVVLDAGCGVGAHARLFAALGAETYGIDRHVERVAQAAQAGNAWCAAGVPGVLRFEHADLAREWCRRYDAIWLHDVLGESDDPDTILVRARAHLAPGGMLGVAEWNGARRRGPTRHPHLWTTARTLRSRLRAHGFQIVLHEFPWGAGLGLPDAFHARCVAPLQRGSWPGRALSRRQMVLATLR